jgi:hypothetical protein
MVPTPHKPPLSNVLPCVLCSHKILPEEDCWFSPAVGILPRAGAICTECWERHRLTILKDFIIAYRPRNGEG